MRFTSLRAIVSLVLALGAFSPLRAANVTWVGLGDGVNWTDWHNWSGNQQGYLPASLDDVTIAGASVSNRTSATVHSIRLDSAAQLTLQYGGQLQLLTDSTNDGTIRISSSSGGLSAGDLRLDGAGQVLFDTGSSSKSISGVRLTLGAQQTISTTAGSLGQITAPLTNFGLVDANGGSLTLNATSSTTNNSTIQARNAGTLVLYGTINNNGSITADQSSTLSLQNATITGGTLAAYGNASITGNPGAGTTLSTNATFGGTTTLAGTLTLNQCALSNNGTFLIGTSTSPNNQVQFRGALNPQGAGQFIFAGSGNNSIGCLDTGAWTVGPSQTITTSAGRTGDILAEVINNGTIAADAGTINLRSRPITNNGLLAARNGGALVLGRTIINTGTITADRSSTLSVQDATITGGTIAAYGNSTITSTTGTGTTLSANITFGGTTTLNGSFITFSSSTITNNGTMLIGSPTWAATPLQLQGAVDLLGAGQVVFSSSGTSSIDHSGAGSWTIGSAQTITTSAGRTGDIKAGFINNGTIAADAGTINLSYQAKTNNGLITARNGGALSIYSPITNTSGTIWADAGTTISLYGSFPIILGGTLGGPGTFNIANSTSLSGGTSGMSIIGPTTITNYNMLSLTGAFRGSGDVYLQNVVLFADALTLDGTSRWLFKGALDNRLGSSTPPAVIGAAQTLGAAGPGDVGTLTGSFVNNGTLQTNGGTLKFDHVTLDNTAGLITVDSGGTLSVTNSSTIIGGTITGAGTIDLAAGTPLTLNATNGMHLSGPTVPLPVGRTLRIHGHLTNDGIIQLTDKSSRVDIDADTAIDGTGQFLFTSSRSAPTIAVASSRTLALGPNQVIATTGANTFGQITGAVVNTGLIDADGGSLSLSGASCTNQALLRARNNGTLTLGTIDNSAGTISAESGSTVVLGTIAGGTLTGGGTFSVPSGASGTLDATVPMNISPGTIVLASGALTLKGAFTNDGLLKMDLLSGPSLSITDYVTLNGSGELRMTAGAILKNTTSASLTIGPAQRMTASGGQLTGVDLENFGAIDLGSISFAGGTHYNHGLMALTGGSPRFVSGAVLINSSDGTLLGDGLLDLRGGTLQNMGILDPERRPSYPFLRISGGYTQTSTGLLHIDIFGRGWWNPDQGPNYDQVQVLSTATLAGALDVDLVNFQPDPTDTFTILTASSIVGHFANAVPTNGIAHAVLDDWECDVVYTSSSVVLQSFTPVPDPTLLPLLLPALLLTRRPRK